MVTAHEEQTVETAVELVSETLCFGEKAPPLCSRAEVMEICLQYFPEYENEIRRYFLALVDELADAEVLAARLQREYLESRWI